jgi:hypothetical protein
VTAFLRTPSKLPENVLKHAKIRVIKGDASIKEDVIGALKGICSLFSIALTLYWYLWADQDAVIQAAVYGSNSPWGTSDSERVVRTIVEAVKQVQATRTTPFRFWLLSGQVLMDLPAFNRIQGDIVPIHPEHYANYDLLKKTAKDLDWSLLCPGKVSVGEVCVFIAIRLAVDGTYSRYLAEGTYYCYNGYRSDLASTRYRWLHSIYW